MQFRKYLIEEDKSSKIDNIINGQNLILFFKKDNNIFGAPEESRLIFAKMKNPDEDVTDDWATEAKFSAFDLMQALMGKEVQNLFSSVDIPKIQIIDDNKAKKILLKCPAASETIKLKPPQDDPGIIKLKDRK